MKDFLLTSLVVSAALFFVVGLPFLTRWAPYIPGPRDLYDPIKDSSRRLDYKPEPSKKKKMPMILRILCVYGVLLAASLLGVGIYNLVK